MAQRKREDDKRQAEDEEERRNKHKFIQEQMRLKKQADEAAARLEDTRLKEKKEKLLTTSQPSSDGKNAYAEGALLFSFKYDSKTGKKIIFAKDIPLEEGPLDYGRKDSYHQHPHGQRGTQGEDYHASYQYNIYIYICMNVLFYRSEP